MNIIEKQLNLGNTIIVKLSGDSMTPFIKSRQAVKVKPSTWQQAKVGEIVYCRVHGKYYLHQVKAIDVRRGCLIGNLKGRINGWTKQVLGKAIEILED
jgi:phage repressor protein C with HTH and peptisase S24 domain